MPKIPRQTHIVFGDNGASSEFAQFGSEVNPPAIKTKDISTIMAGVAWLIGWTAAIFGANKARLLEDINAVWYVHSKQMGYLFQAGVPEWDASTIYWKGSIVQRTDGGGNATAELYASAIDDNQGNAPPVQTNDANWTYLNPPPTPVGTVIESAAISTPVGYLPADAAAVSRTTFAALLNFISVTLGGTITAGLPQITGLPSTAKLQVGWPLSGAGIPTGAVILTIDSGSQVTMSLNALGNGTPAILFAPFGVGDGTTTFNTPNRQRRVGVGSGGAAVGPLANTLGAKGGEETHLLTVGEMPSHAHTGYNTPNGITGQSGVGSHLMEPGNTGLTGGGAAHNNLQPSIVMNYYIKF